MVAARGENFGLSAKPEQVAWRTGGGWLGEETDQIAIDGFANADEQRPTRPMAREVDPDPPDAGFDHGSGFEQLLPECGNFFSSEYGRVAGVGATPTAPAGCCIAWSYN